MSFFTIIVAIIIAEYLISQVLEQLNSKNRNQELPKELQGIYEDEKYRKSQEYGKTNSRFSAVSSLFQLVVVLLMLFLGGFAYIDNIATQLFENKILATLAFFAILYFISEIINIPFSIYSTFVIEEKFGFNKMNVKTFVADTVKSWILTIILGGIIMSIIVWFYYQTTDLFWLYTWAFISVFTIFMTMFYSNLIVPLFNKQTPLEEGELRQAINDFATKVGFKLDNIYVIDGSKRSSKANAYFTGLGHKKRIVLYDTLINDLSINEIVAVLAHEIGHYKHKHTTLGMILSILQTGLMFYILSLFISNPELSTALGADKPTFELALVAFMILFSPISTLLSLFMNIISRKNEYQADGYAAKYGLAAELISALKKLTVNSLSNLTPHAAYVFVYYSHPILYQRIMAIYSITNGELQNTKGGAIRD